MNDPEDRGQVAVGRPFPHKDMKQLLKHFAQRVRLDWVLARLRREGAGFWVRPPLEWTRAGSLRRLSPVSRTFGFDRGLPIDRYYIEAFLSENSTDIQGRVLEIGESTYTRKFGGALVIRGDVLHVTEGNPGATIVADLTSAPQITSDTFDCILFVETLQHIYDSRAAVRTLYRILKPGGVILATADGIGQISRYDMERWGDYWRFTTLSFRRIFEEAFPPDLVSVVAFGNVFSATAFLYGLAAEELEPSELKFHDPDYQVLVALRATKPGQRSGK